MQPSNDQAVANARTRTALRPRFRKQPLDSADPALALYPVYVALVKGAIAMFIFHPQ
jgi:hypothetical protein